MFLKACKRDLGSLDTLLAAGKIRTIQAWLSEKIHQYGCLRLPKEILASVCGEPLSAAPLLFRVFVLDIFVYDFSGLLSFLPELSVIFILAAIVVKTRGMRR